MAPSMACKHTALLYDRYSHLPIMVVHIVVSRLQQYYCCTIIIIIGSRLKCFTLAMTHVPHRADRLDPKVVAIM